jgi:hypothetical protein
MPYERDDIGGELWNRGFAIADVKDVVQEVASRLSA